VAALESEIAMAPLRQAPRRRRLAAIVGPPPSIHQGPRPRSRRRGSLAAAVLQPRRFALVTLSGRSIAVAENNVWCGIADVMASVHANIEDAAGAFTRSDKVAKKGGMDKSFVAYPFGTRLTPLSTGHMGSDGESYTVAIVMKVSIEERSVQEMTDLLHSKFPGLVCTVCYGGVPEESVSTAEEAPMLRGTIRLFGLDRVGQLLKIADRLAFCRVTISHLFVASGFGDRETYEFVEAPGGPLSENLIIVNALDHTAASEDVLQRELSGVVKEVGYAVASIIFDQHRGGRGQQVKEELATYYLERKAYIKEFVEKNQDHDVCYDPQVILSGDTVIRSPFARMYQWDDR